MVGKYGETIITKERKWVNPLTLYSYLEFLDKPNTLNAFEYLGISFTNPELIHARKGRGMLLFKLFPVL